MAHFQTENRKKNKRESNSIRSDGLRPSYKGLCHGGRGLGGGGALDVSECRCKLASAGGVLPPGAPSR